MMKKVIVKSRFVHFDLPKNIESKDETTITPGISGTAFLKYGKHTYYFRNHKTLKGKKVNIRHKNIISPGFKRLIEANYKKYRTFHTAKSILQRYHYGFNLMEQIMYMGTPHSVTSLNDGKFVISFMAYFGFLIVDCINEKVEYYLLENDNDSSIMGNHTWFDEETNELYYTTYSLKDSFKKIENTNFPVRCSLKKYNLGTEHDETIWVGNFSDYLHDINIDKKKNFCSICEFSMYEKNEKLVPSKGLVIDLKTKKHWVIPDLKVAAHSPIDPIDDNIFYFSNHNFRFVHTNFFILLRKAILSIDFKGPASISKYKITKDGPKLEGIFTNPDMYRMQNMHVYMNGQNKLLAGLAFPDNIYIIDADELKLLEKIVVTEDDKKKSKAIIGTFSVSKDGKRFYVQTTKSFQIIDCKTKQKVYNQNFKYMHIYPNHMETSSDTTW